MLRVWAKIADSVFLLPKRFIQSMPKLVYQKASFKNVFRAVCMFKAIALLPVV